MKATAHGMAQPPDASAPGHGAVCVDKPAKAPFKRFGGLIRHLGAIALSAVLIAAAAPGIGHWHWLVPLAFFPWLAALRGLSCSAAALSGLAMGMAYIAPGRWQTFAAPLATEALPGLQHNGLLLLFFASFALPFALFAAIDARLQRTLALQSAWSALPRAALLATLVCGLWSPFAYTPVAMIADWPEILQPASLGGEALVLTLLLWPSAALASLWNRPWAGWRNLKPLLPVILAWSAAAAFGQQRLQGLDQARVSGLGHMLSAMPLQLDLPMSAAERLLSRDWPNAHSSALELTRSGLRQSPRCDLVVWPETPLDEEQTGLACNAVSTAASTLGAPLLMQCIRPAQERSQVTAEWLRPGIGTVEWHAKSSLVPFYEQPLLAQGKLLAGNPGTVFALDAGRRIIPALCYELHSRAHLRAGVLNGGNVIAHMASFAVFARHPIDTWDGAMARIRAVEFGVPIIRAINRGPIGWIDAGGREHQVGARFGRQAPCLDIWLPATSPTVFTWISPLAPWLPGVLTLAITLALSMAGRRRRSVNANAPDAG